jgi:hypothetical protein
MPIILILAIIAHPPLESSPEPEEIKTVEGIY